MLINFSNYVLFGLIDSSHANYRRVRRHQNLVNAILTVSIVKENTAT
jgi:hypothetical protein